MSYFLMAGGFGPYAFNLDTTIPKLYRDKTERFVPVPANLNMSAPVTYQGNLYDRFENFAERNGTILAFSRQGLVLRSTNGISWTPIPSPFTQVIPLPVLLPGGVTSSPDYRRVAAVNGHAGILAVRGAEIAVTTNRGDTWNVYPAPVDFSDHSVDYYEGIYYIFDSNRIYRSSDALSWTLVITPFIDLAGTIIGGGYFVRGGLSTISYSSTAEGPWVNTGIAGVVGTLGYLPGAGWVALTSNNPSSTQNYFSSDLTNWNPISGLGGRSWNQIKFDQKSGVLIAVGGWGLGGSQVGERGQVGMTTDGITWTVKDVANTILWGIHTGAPNTSGWRIGSVGGSIGTAARTIGQIAAGR